MPFHSERNAQRVKRPPNRYGVRSLSLGCKAHGQQHPRERRTEYGHKGYPPSVIREVDDIVPAHQPPKPFHRISYHSE